MNKAIIVDDNAVRYQEKQTPVYLPGKGMVENIKLQREPAITSFQTRFGKIAIFICKDFLRLRDVIPQWAYSNGVQYIIVPSFTKKVLPFYSLPVPQPLTLPRLQYFLRFRSIRRCVKNDHVAGNIPDYHWIMARSLPTFTGFFNHLIELNDFTVQNDIHGELKNGGASFKKISLMNVFRSELLRLLLGLQCWYRAGGPTLHPAPIKWQGALQVPRAPRQRQK
ncbi:MAG: hypothetical protein ACTSUE_00730 [Promethearchaeota archaeon]